MAKSIISGNVSATISMAWHRKADRGGINGALAAAMA